MSESVDWGWKLREGVERLKTQYDQIGRKTGAPFLGIVYPPEAEAAVLKEWHIMATSLKPEFDIRTIDVLAVTRGVIDELGGQNVVEAMADPMPGANPEAELGTMWVTALAARAISSKQDHAENGDVPAGRVRIGLAVPALYLRSTGNGTVPGSNTAHGTTGAGNDNGDLVEFTNCPSDEPPEVVVVTGSTPRRFEVVAVADDGTWFEVTASKGDLVVLVDDVDVATNVRSVLKVGGTLYSAPDRGWYDNDGKGDCSVWSWEWDRTTDLDVPSFTTLDTEHPCFQFDRCNPSVVCLSPNYDPEAEVTIDSFDYGVTYGFGGTTGDMVYGLAWQGIFKQAMQDLFWEPPPQQDCQDASDDSELDCQKCPNYFEDNGLCGEDSCEYQGGGVWTGVNYYQHWPLVEQRETRPEAWAAVSANPWPLAYDMGYSPPDILGMQGCGDGGTPDPGYLCGNTYVLPNVLTDEGAPWIPWLNMQQCICANGRFAEDYKAVLGCWMCGAEPTPYVGPVLDIPDVVLPPDVSGADGMTSGDNPMTGQDSPKTGGSPA